MAIKIGSLPGYSAKIILIWVLLALFDTTKSQPALFNVPEAFNAISAMPSLLHLKNDAVKIPCGGHLQGIQSLSDSVFIITASSNSFSYYVIAQFNPFSSNGHIRKLKKIADRPYRHAGGCQLNEGTMAAGIEDNLAKNKSEIMMFLFNDSTNEESRQMITHRQGFVKRSSAGAVGFTKVKTGKYLVAVGDWDSRNIDFYLSRTHQFSRFDSLTTFHAPESQKWCSYQSLNLLSDTAGNLYLIGFALDGLNNRADLFKLDLDNYAVRLSPINTRNFKCTGGAGFRYGAGIGISKSNSLVIYCCARNVGRSLSVNLFKWP